MSTVAISGKDTLVFRGKVLTGLADGNAGELTFPNELMKIKIGKDGNALYALDTTGQMSELTLRIVRGCADDEMLLADLNSQQQDPPSFVLIPMQITKRLGDGKGNVKSDVYSLGGGVFTKIPGVKDNVEGDTEQSVSIYVLRFSNTPTPRTLT